jgi:hypothetical protein
MGEETVRTFGGPKEDVAGEGKGDRKEAKAIQGLGKEKYRSRKREGVRFLAREDVSLRWPHEGPWVQAVKTFREEVVQAHQANRCLHGTA